jgi:uncharacterized protein (TIGR01244 family)
MMELPFKEVPSMQPRRAATLLVIGACLASAGASAQVTKQSIPGIANLARLETTVACSGAIKAEAVPEIKQMGFVSIINLREAAEDGANIEAEQAAAKTAGLRYFHVPFNGTSPAPVAADRFLDAITTPGAEPAFIHCAGGNRAASMWLIKRLAVDHWEADRAVAEARALGLTSGALQQFAIDYARGHSR